MVLLLFAFVLAVGVGAHAATRWLFRLGEDEPGVDPPTGLERAFATALVALSLTLSAEFGLALVGALSRGPLLALALLALGLGLWAEGREMRGALDRKLVTDANTPWLVAAVAVLALWTAFVLWRGHTLFVLNHDGLAYHMPRAHLMAESGRLGPFSAQGADGRITWPPGYELLLALTIILGGDDTWSAWVGTASYLSLLLAVAATTSRAWGGGAVRGLVPVLVVAAMPVVILHAGAHKNDLMTAALGLALVHFLSRWAANGGTSSIVLALLAGGALLGTKLSGFFLGPACVIVFVIGALRARRNGGVPRGKKLGVVGLAALLSATLVGPVTYVYSRIVYGRAIVPVERNLGWGDFRNVWEFAYLVFAKPFSSVDRVHVPWTNEDWFWPDNDIFMSTWGAAVTLALAAVPIVLWARRRAGAGPKPELRYAALVAIVMTFGLLAFRDSPEGFFNCSVRYTILLPIVIVVWTIGGALELASRTSRGAVLERGALVLATALFAYNDWDLARRDGTQPFAAFMIALGRPDADRTVWSSPNRAGSVVDRLAGPTDHIAVDGAFDAWIYPAYGRDRTRRVTVIPHDDGREIPEDVDWVIVDRSWSCYFGHPAFQTMGDWWKYIARGAPTEDDLAVFRRLAGDPRFRLVYHEKRSNQAVFRRLRSSDSPEPR